MDNALWIQNQEKYNDEMEKRKEKREEVEEEDEEEEEEEEEMEMMMMMILWDEDVGDKNKCKMRLIPA